LVSKRTLLTKVFSFRSEEDLSGDGEDRRRIPLDVLERETGLSRHSIIRARAGKRLHPRTLELLARTAMLGLLGDAC
jgi:hypothetical protein